MFGHDQEPTGARPSTPAVAVVVAIGVCTAQRPVMLGRCLDSIASQTLPARTIVHLIVVDNEAAPNNRAAVEAFAQGCLFPVHYVHEPRRGIAIARNAVLDKAEELGATWLAFTDDDCRVAPDWLAQLLRAAEHYEADIVYGRQELVYPEGTSEWGRTQPKNLIEGQPMLWIGTHNVLIAGRLFHGQAALRFNERLAFGEDSDFARQALGLRFDTRLTHGSDTVFSDEARRRGAGVVHTKKALVWEDVVPERATFSYQIRLAYRYAVGKVDRMTRHDGWWQAARKSLPHLIFKAPIAIIELATAFALRPFGEDRFRQRVQKHLFRLASTAGLMVGLLGYRGDPYGKIDGR